MTSIPNSKNTIAFNSVLLFVLLMLPKFAAARPAPESTNDQVLFVRGNSLWHISSSGGSATELFSIPWNAAQVSHLAVASDGSALVLQTNDFTLWTSLQTAQKTTLNYLPCGGDAQLSADGSRVVCETQDRKRLALYQLRPKLSVQIIDQKPKGPVFLAGENIISHGDNNTLYAFNDSSQNIVAHHQPSDFLRVSPDGERAVGAYTEGPIDIVYTFLLDGKAIKRTLVHAARPIRFSADSRWIAVQQEIDACAVRVTGGQYMCWQRFQALDISSQGRNLLLSTAGKSVGHDLFVGSVSGTKSRPPTTIVRGVGPAAAFWPRAAPSRD